MRIVDILSEDGEKLINELKSKSSVILVGSAVSSWDPTSLQTGQQITIDVFQFLFTSNSFTLEIKEKQILENLWKNIPLEHLLERCPAQDKLRRVIKSYFECYEPNPLHTAIQQGVSTGIFSSIITTNYDLGLDSALGFYTTNNNKLTKIVNKSDTSKLGHRDHIYFKIHGSADDTIDGKSLVFSLSDESILPTWKRKLLKETLSKQNLIVIGYSGLDFEICPELFNIPFKNIYWNNLLPTPPSKNAKKIISQSSGVLISGDVRDFLSKLTIDSNATNYTSRSFCKKLEQMLSIFEANEWRATILNSIGLPSLALKASNLQFSEFPNKTVQIRKKRQTAQALFHMGKYFTAAKLFKECSNMALQIQDKSLQIELLLDSCDSLRCYGSFIRSNLVLKKSEKLSKLIFNEQKRNRLISKLHLKKVLLRMHYYSIVKKIKPIANRIRINTTKDLLIVSSNSRQTGNWFEYQQATWWAERFGINKADLRGDSSFEPESPKEAYGHLVYFVAQVGYFRDSIINNRTEFDNNKAILLDTYIEYCKIFNNYPEIWKLLSVKRKMNLDKTFNQFSDMLNYFSHCEYRLMFRLFQFLKGS